MFKCKKIEEKLGSLFYFVDFLFIVRLSVKGFAEKGQQS